MRDAQLGLLVSTKLDVSNHKECFYGMFKLNYKILSIKLMSELIIN